MITSIPAFIDAATDWVPIDPQHADRIATSTLISSAWFRRRYLILDRTNRQWGITITGAQVKIRQARADAAHASKHGGPGLRSAEEREDDDATFMFPAAQPSRVHSPRRGHGSRRRHPPGWTVRR